jgi:hypothetical protein
MDMVNERNDGRNRSMPAAHAAIHVKIFSTL